MTYNVFGGTLSLTQSISQSVKTSKQLYRERFLEGWSGWFGSFGLCIKGDD